MTEKRFTQKDEDDWEILDRNKHFAYAHSGYQAEKIIQELNELVETNRELYKDNKQLKQGLNDDLELIGQLQEENEQLKQSYKEFEDECQFTFNAMNRTQNDLYRKNFKLEEENEQLKQRNDRQAKQLDRLYSLIEEKDWTALSDIINDFKRCEEQLQKEWEIYNESE